MAELTSLIRFIILTGKHPGDSGCADYGDQQTQARRQAVVRLPFHQLLYAPHGRCVRTSILDSTCHVADCAGIDSLNASIDLNA